MGLLSHLRGRLAGSFEGCCFKHGCLCPSIDNTLANRDPAEMVLDHSVVSHITYQVLFPHHLPRLLEGNAPQGHSVVLRTLYTHPVSFKRLYQSLHPSSRNCTLQCILILSPHPSDAPGATSDAGWKGTIQATKWRAEDGDGHKGCTGKESTAACLCVQSAGIKDVRQPPCLVHAVHRAPKQLSGSSCC